MGQAVAGAERQQPALSSTSTYFANVNPLRYRGYYYDTETGFYYLQSRYYDPSIGRFVNADAAEYSTMAAYGLSDTNLFVYCRNNPVVYGDNDGNFINTVVGAIVGGLVTAITTDRADPNYVEKVFLGAFTGAISGLGVDVAIAATGGMAVVAILASGAFSGWCGSVVTQYLDGEEVNYGKAATSAMIGMVSNVLSYSISIPTMRVTSGGSLSTRIMINSNYAIYEGAFKPVVGNTSGVALRSGTALIIRNNILTSYANTGVISFFSAMISNVMEGWWD